MTLVVSEYGALLGALSDELFSPDERTQLRAILTSRPFDRSAFVAFDDSLPGPSISRVADHRPSAPGTLGIPGHGSTRCEVEDREIFKPLHYCAISLTSGVLEDVEWRTRDIVEMSGLHLEALLKRITGSQFLPLGDTLLRLVQPKIDPRTWDHVRRYKAIHNDAKHRLDHALGTHLFSLQDAVHAYVVVRRIGQKLYPVARLKTDWTFCSDPPR